MSTVEYDTDLDVRQVHEVLSDVNNKLVHESRSNVETILHVVHVVPKRSIIHI